MARDDAYQFEGFLRAVHRRMVVLRGLERVGMCVLGGCVVLLLLVPVLLWRGEPSGMLLTAVFGVAVVAGLAWGVAARPSRLAAAAEADRQLRLSDLLGTAYLLRRSQTDDDFAAVVLAQAEARCRGVSPSAVALNRWGARGWGGIGLAVALVAGLSLAGPDDRRTEARASASAGPSSWKDLERRESQEGGNVGQSNSTPDYRRAKPGTGGDDADPLKSAVSTSEPAGSSVSAAKDPANSGAGGASEGTGGGAGQSPTKENTGATQTPTGVGGKGTDGRGKPAGGGGAEARAGTESSAGGGVAGSSDGGSRRPVPVWRSDQWPADQEAARAAVRGGAVPEAYRDLVRDYFERP